MTAFLILLGLCAAAPLPAEKPGKEPPLRVLVWTRGMMREYQFLANLLARDTESKRVDVTVCIQPEPGKPEPKKAAARAGAFRSLTRFPDQFNEARKAEGDFDLGRYDVVVAFDPDWGRLDAKQVKGLEKWVWENGGGLVFVAGPFNTRQLADGGKALSPVRGLLPVTLADNKDDRREADRPWTLSFPKVKSRPAYLRLDPDGKDPLAGWAEFFGSPKEGAPPAHGFYQAYPVKGRHAGGVVLAAFTDPKAKAEGGDERPFLALGKAGKGRVTYIGSAELWRVREYKVEAYERLWRGLIADAAGR